MVFQTAVLQRRDFFYLPFEFAPVKFLRSRDACRYAPQFEICIIRAVAFHIAALLPMQYQYTHFPPEFTLW